MNNALLLKYVMQSSRLNTNCIASERVGVSNSQACHYNRNFLTSGVAVKT
jgi:hypothetical protein